MTPTPPPSALTDEQIIECLAKFMGWRRNMSGCITYKADKRCSFMCTLCYVTIPDGCEHNCNNWNPLTDWNHWRQVEEKVMADVSLFRNYRDNLIGGDEQLSLFTWMKFVEADLPTRCRALVSALDSLKND